MSKLNYEQNRPELQVVWIEVEAGFSISDNNDIEDATSQDYGTF